MNDFNRTIRRVFPLLGAMLLLAWAPGVWAHTGHDHADEPTIALPQVVAQVNGQDIPKDAILASLKSSIKKYKDRGMPLSGDQEKIAAKKLIDNEISRQLLLTQSKAVGVQVSSAQVDQRLQEVKKGFRSEKAFLHKLEDEGLTLEQYLKELKEDILIDAVLQKELGQGIVITGDRIRDHYEKHRSQYESPEQRRASVMLIRAKADAGAEQEAQAKELLTDLLKQVRGGKDFATLTKQNSQDTLASRGGDLGYFAKEKMFKAFSERAFSLKVGEVSEVFRTRHGFHILQLTDVKPAVSQSLEAAQEAIREILVKREIKNRTPDYLAKLKKQATIKLYF